MLPVPPDMIPNLINNMYVFGQPLFDAFLPWVWVICGIVIVGILASGILLLIGRLMEQIVNTIKGSEEDEADKIYLLKHNISFGNLPQNVNVIFPRLPKNQSLASPAYRTQLSEHSKIIGFSNS